MLYIVEGNCNHTRPRKIIGWREALHLDCGSTPSISKGRHGRQPKDQHSRHRALQYTLKHIGHQAPPLSKKSLANPRDLAFIYTATAYRKPSTSCKPRLLMIGKYVTVRSVNTCPVLATPLRQEQSLDTIRISTCVDFVIVDMVLPTTAFTCTRFAKSSN